MQICVLLFNQDDPKKCTAAKLVKFKMAKDVKRISKTTLVLDPFAQKTLLKKDKALVDSITAIDCSWNKADTTFSTNFSGIKRKLPPLFAGNPVNYSKLGKLTTAEAIAGALFLMGYNEEGQKILDKFKWGHTFYELNQNLLAEYSKAESEKDYQKILQDFGLGQVLS